MYRVFAAGLVLILCLSSAVLGQSTPVDKGILQPSTPVSDILPANEPYQYTLSLSENQPFTISIAVQPANISIYGYVLDNDGHVSEPSLNAFRDATLTQVYSGCAALPCSLILEGDGRYTLNLSAGNTLHPPEEVIRTGDTVNGSLPDGQSRAYLLETGSEDIITLSLIQDRQPVYARLMDNTGQQVQPVFEHLDALKGIRTQIFKLSRTQIPFSVLVSGAGKYTLQIASGDTLRIDGGEMRPGETREEVSPSTGFAVFTLADTSADAVSIVYDGGARAVFLQDSTGQRLFATTVYVDRTSLQHIAVFELSDNTPYTLTIQAENNYTATVVEGDISRMDTGLLSPNIVTALDIPAGMTPVFTLESANESTLITLIFTERTVFTGLDIQFRAQTGSPVVPERITPADSGLVITGIPSDSCPCQFIPRISGRFSISVADKLPDKTALIQLTQADVNLRAGANLRAPVVATGDKDEQLTAFARSEDNAWLLAVTDTRIVVWVYRQLTTSSDSKALESLPIAGSTAIVEEPEATVEATQEVTTTATPSEATPEFVTTVPATATTPPAITATSEGLIVRPIATFPCMVTSGGGVNMRQGPGTEYLIAGSLTDGSTTGVIAQSYDSDGNIWWQLENNRWVRADVVVEIGDCTGAPTQKPG